MDEKVAAFKRLLYVMDELREKCPWNAEQTWESIRRLTEEEVYELSDAIMKGESSAVCKEIGDLLYHMVFYARIAQEQGKFDIADSMDKVCDKMIFRHPHVFGPEAGKHTTAKEIADTWELVKSREKGGNKTVMEGIPDAMPALLKAVAMQEKARGCGFDWEKPEDVWPKVLEEVDEAREACTLCSGDSGSVSQEEVRKTGFEKPSTGRFSESIPPTHACDWAPPTHGCVGADGFSVPLPDSTSPESPEPAAPSLSREQGRSQSSEPLCSPESPEPAAPSLSCEQGRLQSSEPLCSPESPEPAAPSLSCEQGRSQSAEPLCSPESPEPAAPSLSREQGRSQSAEPLCSPESPEQKKTEEFGDLLFAVINAARLHGVDPEAALSAACSKFRRRFNYVEASIRGAGRSLSGATLPEMDALWDEAKSKGL